MGGTIATLILLIGRKMKPSEWCKNKMREAKDGDDAYAYFQLMQHWKQKGL